MKCALTVALFRLFTIGVLTDGKEIITESVLVKDGDSVTLKSGLNKREKDDGIEWKFNGNPIIKISGGSTRIQDKSDGSFRGKLKLDEQSGDLKISNIRTTEAGQYKPEISSPDGTTLDVTFTVNVVPDTEVKPVPVTVMKGDSVTLRADLTGIEKYGEIQWRFGEQTFPGSSLTITDITAQDTGLYKADISSSSSRYIIHHIQSLNVTISDEVVSVSVLEGDTVTLLTGLTEIQTDDQILWKLGDHERITLLNGSVTKIWSNIDLNCQTGDLNIKNIQRGDYKVEINTRRMISHRKYHINIGKDAVKRVSKKKGEYVNLQIDTKIQNYELIQWIFGNDIIVQMNKTSEQLFKGPDKTFRDRLKLNHQTGSLTITDTRTTDSGHYTWSCKSSRYIIDRTINFYVVPDPHPGPDPGWSPCIVFAVVVVAALLVSAIVFCFKKKYCSHKFAKILGQRGTYLTQFM